jgi:hypothetical protein
MTRIFKLPVGFLWIAEISRLGYRLRYQECTAKTVDCVTLNIAIRKTKRTEGK